MFSLYLLENETHNEWWDFQVGLILFLLLLNTTYLSYSTFFFVVVAIVCLFSKQTIDYLWAEQFNKDYWRNHKNQKRCLLSWSSFAS